MIQVLFSLLYKLNQPKVTTFFLKLFFEQT
nr:MAG TPA: hypothetical protein [Caudoviricetes sp.]